MDWFRRKSLPVPGTTAFYVSGLSNANSRTLKTYAEEGYEQNPIVNTCVNKIAEACSSVKLEVHSYSAKGEKKVVSTHKLLDLLARPNPTQSWTDLIKEMVSWHRNAGEVFVIRFPDTGPAQELYCLNPGAVDIKKNPNGSAVPLAYIYGSGENKKTYPVNVLDGSSQVMHIKTFNPSDSFRGLSPLKAAARATDTHNNGAAWNSNLLLNSARPSGVVSFEKGVTTSESTMSQLREYFKKVWQGYSAAGDVAFLTGGATFTPLSHSPKDMDFKDSMSEAAKNIALVFGVPLPLITMEAATHSNMEQAEEALWIDTVLPLLNVLIAGLSSFLMPLYGQRGAKPNEVLAYNSDSVPALEARRERLYKRMVEAAGNKPLLTQDEARAEMGFPALGGQADELASEAPAPEIAKTLKSIGYSDEEIKQMMPEFA